MDPTATTCEGLATEFEEALMKARVDKVEDVRELRELCKQLIGLNFRMKAQFADWLKSGWLSK